MKKVYECKDGNLRSDIMVSSAGIKRTGSRGNEIIFDARTLTKDEIKKLIDRQREANAARDARLVQEKAQAQARRADDISALSDMDLMKEYNRQLDAGVVVTDLRQEALRRGLLKNYTVDEDAAAIAALALRARLEGWYEAYEDGYIPQDAKTRIVQDVYSDYLRDINND